MTAPPLGAMLRGMSDPDNVAALERAVVGALRSAIRAHGPIGPEGISSAAKRIVGSLVNAKLGALATVMGRKRWAGLSAEQRQAIAHRGASKGGSSAWAGMSTSQRSTEMRRRWAVRKARAK